MINKEIWEKWQIDYLIENYHNISPKDIAKHINRTERAIRCKADILGLTNKVKHKIWETWEIDYLLKYYGKISIYKIMKRLGRTFNSIHHKAIKLGLKFPQKEATLIYRKGRTWEKEYGVRKARKMKKKHIERYIDKNYEEIYGKDKAIEMKKKQSINCSAKRPEMRKLRSILGKKKAKEISIFFKKWWKNPNNKDIIDRMSKDNSIRFLGKNNPMFKDGNGKAPYPMGFSTKSKEIRKRDKICKYCGISNEKHKIKYNRLLHVHHIDGDRNNNEPLNLICLCDYHHGKIVRFYLELQDHFHAKILNLI